VVGGLPEVVPYPNPSNCPRQKIIAVKVAAFAHVVLFVEGDDHFFL